MLLKYYKFCENIENKNFFPTKMANFLPFFFRKKKKFCPKVLEYITSKLDHFFHTFRGPIDPIFGQDIYVVLEKFFFSEIW